MPSAVRFLLLCAVVVLSVGSGGDAQSAARCEDIFATQDRERNPDADRAVELEALRTNEVEAERLLATLIKSPEAAAQDVRLWVDRLRWRQESGAPLSLKEFTAVSFLFRSGLIEKLAGEHAAQTVRDVLKRGWRKWAKREPIDSKLGARLPNRALEGESRESLLFYFASYEDLGPAPKTRFTSPFQNYVAEKYDRLGVVIGMSSLAALAFARTGGAEIAGALIGYTTSTLVEHVLHRALGHPARGLRVFLENAGPWARVLRETTFSHLRMHHAKTFKSFTEQFGSEAERDELFRELEADPNVTPAQIESLKKTKLGLTLDIVGQASIVAITAPVLWGLSRIIHADVPTTIALFSPLTVQILSPVYLHTVIHLKRAKLMTESPAFVRWLACTRIVEAIVRSHFMHHKGGGRNFNLLPGGDFLLGQYQRPNLKHVFKMRDQDVIGSRWDGEKKK